MTPPGYAELGALSNFTFLEGASHPHELVGRAEALGHAAIGIADRNSFAGLVRGHVAAEETKLRFVPGARVVLPDGGGEYLAWPTDRAAYGRLARLLSKGRMEAPKGECRIARGDLVEHADGLVMALLPPEAPDAFSARQGRDAFAARLARDAAALRCSPRAACGSTTRAGAVWPTCWRPSASAPPWTRSASRPRRTPRRT